MHNARTRGSFESEQTWCVALALKRDRTLKKLLAFQHVTFRFSYVDSPHNKIRHTKASQGQHYHTNA